MGGRVMGRTSRSLKNVIEVNSGSWWVEEIGHLQKGNQFGFCWGWRKEGRWTRWSKVRHLWIGLRENPRWVMGRGELSFGAEEIEGWCGIRLVIRVGRMEKEEAIYTLIHRPWKGTIEWRGTAVVLMVWRSWIRLKVFSCFCFIIYSKYGSIVWWKSRA